MTGLERLRGRPPAGTWVPDQEGSWPGPEGFIDKEEARKEARRRGCTAIARVVNCAHGWTTTDTEEI